MSECQCHGREGIHRCPVLGMRVGPADRRLCEGNAEWREKAAAVKSGKPCPPKRDRGLGDTLERGFKALGIDRAAKAVAKAVGAKDCGCAKRRDRLNRLVPYKPATEPPI